jgi:hypothetical protein
MDFPVFNARQGHLAAVHCNQMPVAGILVSGCGSRFLLQTVGRLGIISANPLLRAAALIY